MTPQEKLDSVIKSIEFLKALYGENLKQLPNDHNGLLAANILDAHRRMKVIVGMEEKS
jgi:hypothetical protein